MRVLLSGLRLVTVVGTAGCGKTRLAQRMADDTSDLFPDGWWSVELAPLSNADLVPGAVMGVLGLVESPGSDPLEQIGQRLGDGRVLVLLDNCEHLLGAVAEVAAGLLARCPNLTVLATSREPLRVPGEVTWRLPSLSLPAEKTGRSVEQPLTFDAVRLFVERAAEAQPDFRVHPDNVRTVVAICRRLDGIPLAIELAVARLRSFDLESIEAGLANRFLLLTGGPLTALPRHQTLQASLEWSHDLLEGSEQTLLRRLAVFRGGFSLDAAEDVAAGTPLEQDRILPLLSSLVDKSLVAFDGTRYGLLETIREFARARLDASREAEAVRERHATHYAMLAHAAESGLLGAEASRWRRWFAAELDNIRAADDWAAGAGRADLALRFGAGELWFHGRPSEGHRRLTRALGLPGGSPGLQGRALLARLKCDWTLGNFDAVVTSCQEVIDLADRIGDAALKGEAVFGIGWGGLFAGNEDAPRLMDEALALQKAGGTHPYWIAISHMGRGAAAFYTGEADDARKHLGEAVRLFLACGSPAAARPLALLGMALLFEGDMAAAEEVLDQARGLLGDITEETSLHTIEAGLGWLDALRGTPDQGLAVCDAAVEGARAIEQTYSTSLASWIRQVVEFCYGRAGAPLPRLDETEATLQSQGVRCGVAWCRAIRAEHLLASGDLPGARRAAESAMELVAATRYAGMARGRACLALARVLRAEGEVGRAEDTAHEALRAFRNARQQPGVLETMELLSGLAAAQHSPAEGTRLLAAATTTRERLGCSLPPVGAPVVHADLDTARRALGPAAFDAAWAEGTDLTLDEAIAYASRGRGERRKRPAAGWDSLTPTEAEVARLVAEGRSNAEVAAALFMSVATVKTHLQHAYAKLGVANRASLAALAARRG